MDLAHWRGARAAASETAPTERFRSLLLSRFVLLNAAGLLGLAVAWRQGLLERIWQADSSGISLAIVALFAWTMGMAFVRAGKLSQALDDLAAGRPAGKAEAYRAALRAGVDARVAGREIARGARRDDRGRRVVRGGRRPDARGVGIPGAARRRGVPREG